MNEKEEKIIKLLENKDMSVRDFTKSSVSRQMRSYYLPKLMKKRVIKSYKRDGVDFYTLVRLYKNPQDIIELIEAMQSKDKSVRERSTEKFKSLCITRNLGQRKNARNLDGTKIEVHEYYDDQDIEGVKAETEKYAKILSAGLNPNKLKEKLAYKLTYIEDLGETWDDDQTESWYV